jgi:hypothetical protein
MPVRSPIGRASTANDLLFLLGPGGRNPCRMALFKTSLKLRRVLWTSSFRRRSTSGSSVTVVRTVAHHDSNTFAVKIAGAVRPRPAPLSLDRVSAGINADDRYWLLAIFFFRIWAYQVSISACG